VFNIPLNTSSTAEDYEFIHYVTPNDTARAVKGPRAFHGITLNFDLSVDEKTTVKITTSYGKLEGTGTANNLKLNISSLGDFNMYGNYLITNGKFEFVAKDVVSKNFQVTQGGTIRWTGDPTNAEINMHAIYEVRTNVQNLYIAAGQTSNSAKANATVVLVQAELILTKSLLLPVIDFDFTFPTDPGIKDDLGTYLNDYNNRSQQALSVIVTRNFSSGTGNAQFTNQALTSAVNELFFTKLNSLIAHSNAIRNLDLNIRSFNDASATIHLLHDRVVLSGSLYSNTDPTGQLFYNAGSLFNSNFNNLSKDFSAQYLILKNGSLNARYSYRILNTAQTNFDFYNAQYVNALGLIYQRDFDTFGEFVRNIFHPGRRRRINPLPEPKVTPSSPPPPTPVENAGSKALDGN
jgi:hypothetical protein